MISHKGHLVDAKAIPLSDAAQWTTHYVIYLDSGDRVMPVRNCHMGNRCSSEEEAVNEGHRAAIKIIDCSV